MTSTNTSTEINESDYCYYHDDDDDAESNQDTYGYIESKGYEKLFEFIRLDLLENPRLIIMAELRKLLFDYMHSVGAAEKNFRRKLEFEFGDLLQYEDLIHNISL